MGLQKIVLKGPKGDVLGRHMLRNNSEMLHPWSKEALLQKYSIRRNSKASLAEPDAHRKAKDNTMSLNLIDRLNLHTIKSKNSTAKI